MDTHSGVRQVTRIIETLPAYLHCGEAENCTEPRVALKYFCEASFLIKLRVRRGKPS